MPVAKQRRRQPIWHPIEAVPAIARLIDGQLEAAEEELRLLRRAGPGSLDDATVERVVRVFTEEMEFLDLHEEQLARWRKEPLSPAQRTEVDRLGRQVARNREVAGSILELAEELRATTINAILATSDLELGLEVLLGGFPTVSGRTSPKRSRRHSG